MRPRNPHHGPIGASRGGLDRGGEADLHLNSQKSYVEMVGLDPRGGD